MLEKNNFFAASLGLAQSNNHEDVEKQGLVQQIDRLFLNANS